MELEKKIKSSTSTESNSDDKKQIAILFSDASHNYADEDVIKIFKYIKDLEKEVSLNNIVTTASAAKKNDSAIVKAAEPPVAIHPVEQMQIDFYEKVIFFNRRSDSIKTESFKPLDEVVLILKKYPDLNFEVEGHTDSVGSLEYNQDLSEKRALNVKNYFISKGIPSSKISSIGYGETKPIATNETPEGKAINRRVRIKVKK